MIDTIINLLQHGLGSLASYLAAHVLLCLLPAFFIAGALVTMIPKAAITRYLGKNAPKWISYPAAALGGFVLAVCSCTIMPLFASIHKKGAGIGPAITFLFVGPAVNILAISFTGVQIGMDIALARVLLSIFFGILIGLLIAWIFKKDEAERQKGNNQLFAHKAAIPGKNTLFFVLLLAILITGTLQINLFQSELVTVPIQAPWANRVQVLLSRWIPSNPDLGIEGVSVHGLILIGLLVLIGASAVKGLSTVDESFNNWTYLTLILITITLLIASIKLPVIGNQIAIILTGRFLTETILMIALWIIAKQLFSESDLGSWLWETWRFVKQILPLLLAGVFAAGVVRGLIPANWIESIAGKNTLMANLIGVLFGVFMYFPTLVEVPIAQTFLSLGMHRGPLLAYLLADPELSIQSILITSSVIGKKKTFVYVILVTIFTTLAGLIFGYFIT